MRAADTSSQTLATVVVVPRERFDLAVKSFASLVDTIAPAVRIVYVTGGLPRKAEQAIRDRARGRPLEIIRCDDYLTPNQARNLALPLVETTYIAFADNDIQFAPGWLDALIRCAELQAASVVAPLICAGDPTHSTIHNAGGKIAIVERDGIRLFYEKHRFLDHKVADVRDHLVRQPVDFGEFHCMLVRRSVFELHGLLDEALLCANEHLDLCLAVRGDGGRIYFEPDAVVTQMMPPLPLGAVPYFVLRWSDDWSVKTDRHFYAKWNLVRGAKASHIDHFIRRYRHHSLPRLRKALFAIGGWRLGLYACNLIDRALAAVAARRLARNDPAVCRVRRRQVPVPERAYPLRRRAF